jgi:hypothetical protein
MRNCFAKIFTSLSFFNIVMYVGNMTQFIYIFAGKILVGRKMALIVKTYLSLNIFRYFINNIFLITKIMDKTISLNDLFKPYLAFKTWGGMLVA